MLIKSKFMKCLGIVCLSLFSFNAFAQATPPAPELADATPVPEGTGSLVSVDVNWASDGTVALIQFDINYDSTNLTPDLTNCNNVIVAGSVITVSCSNPSAGVVRIAADDSGLNVIASQLLTSVDFDVSAAAVGVYPLTVSGEVYGDSVAQGVTPGTPDDGSITIQGPAYTSNPTPAAGVDLGAVIQNATNPTAGVLITNTGAAGTTLTVTGCSITGNPGVFSVDSTAQFQVMQGAQGATRTVTCDSSNAIQVHMGEMTCNHDGGPPGETDPAFYALSCNITAGPQPVYNSNPAPGMINMTTDEESDPVPDVVIEIDNDSGQAGSSLDGSCTLSGPDANGKITLAGAGFMIPMGGTHSLQTISCDSSQQGTYTATLTCNNNDQTNSTPMYPIECVIPPPGAAVFRSDPVPGTIDMTENLDVAAGDTVPDKVLTFYNDAQEQDDNDLMIQCVADGAGSAEITASADLSASIPPGGNASVTFMCDATNPSNYSKDYNCSYTVDGTSLPAGTGGPLTADYTVTCDVRDAKSEVVPMPEETLTQTVESGGSAQFSVIFEETADEGVDGSVDCSLADGTDFVIDTVLPADVPAGDMLSVVVTGTDPGTDTGVTDTLNCTYTDTDNPEGVDVSYPLVLTVGGSTKFTVTKDFTDGYDGDVLVRIECDDGLPLKNQAVISPGSPVKFTVTDFENGTLNCSVTEGHSTGYTVSYTASGDSSSVDDDPNAPGCHFSAVSGSDSNTCAVTNTPTPVDLLISKEWVVPGAIGDDFIPGATLTLYCDSEIVGGQHEYDDATESAALNGGNWYKAFSGLGDQTYNAQVIPQRPYTSCWVVESTSVSGVEVENGCTNIQVTVGSVPQTCTVTNTVFFEGIPTLSQWGMAIMALLMLGIGMLGFRRYA